MTSTKKKTVAGGIPVDQPIPDWGGDLVANPIADDVPPGIHCCVCLQRGKYIQAATIVKGYACCKTHVALVGRPGFDIFQLRTDKSFT